MACGQSLVDHCLSMGVLFSDGQKGAIKYFCEWCGAGGGRCIEWCRWVCQSKVGLLLY